MKLALQEAEKASAAGEIPVGAVVIFENKIIGRGHNQREALQDPTAHAEMLAITAAAASLKSWRLDRCCLYVTLEPCPMCTGAILNAKIPHIVFGAYDRQAGMCGSVDNLCDLNLLNHRTTIRGGILQNECRALLNSFFSRLRKG